MQLLYPKKIIKKDTRFDKKKIEHLFNLISTRNGPAQAPVMMKSVLSSAEHGRCPHKY